MREIEAERIVEIKRLLSEGYSRRQVVHETGVSLGTVNRVATGQRPDCAAVECEEEEDDAEDDEFLERCGPIRRCQECGYLVEMPCLVCQARAVHEESLRGRRELLAFENGARLQPMRGLREVGSTFPSTLIGESSGGVQS